MKLALTDNFKQRVIAVHGETGAVWLEKLPGIIDQCLEKWFLTSLLPLHNLSYNFVALAETANTKFILKIGVPCRKLTNELNALTIFKGPSCVNLIEHDSVLGAMLLEYLSPGDALTTHPVDEEAIIIAAGIMQKLWHAEPTNHEFSSIARWAKDLAKIRANFSGTSGPFPERLVEQAEKLFPELIKSSKEKTILHGDLHHDNILKSGANWVAIDPKGLVGEPSFEAAFFARNFLITQPDPKRVLLRRVDILSEILKLDRERILNWGIAQTVLSAWWSYEAHYPLWQQMVDIAELFAELRK